MAEIIYSNFKIFDSFELATVKTLVERHAGKLERSLPDCKLTFYGKKYDKAGKRVKYSFHAKVHQPHYFIAESAGWDLSTAVHKTMEKLVHEVQKKLKTEGKKQKKLFGRQRRERIEE